jgi:Integrase core domain
LQKLRCYTGFMNIELLAHAALSDDELLAEVVKLAASERTATVCLIAALAEVDSRRLYLGQGCSSLFVYCTSIVRLESSAHAKEALFDYIEVFYNQRRRHSTLGQTSPAEFEKRATRIIFCHRRKCRTEEDQLTATVN